MLKQSLIKTITFSTAETHGALKPSNTLTPKKVLTPSGGSINARVRVPISIQPQEDKIVITFGGTL